MLSQHKSRDRQGGSAPLCKSGDLTGRAPIHISLIGDKVWIQFDDTEEGIATDLMTAGVSREDIVLGFRHPKIRRHNGFAVA
ncbi:MAG: XisI protein [Pseudanabaenales cyanobacterium]|nr:XisI protein [Pseudanabaenales cyanobacterium]